MWRVRVFQALATVLVFAGTAGAVGPGWEAVPYKAQAPRGGVTLQGGLFEKAMEDNIRYLLDSFSVDDMLYMFRVRAGQTNPRRDRPVVKFWETSLEGSIAGRFLMGAGNTLRWQEHPELRRRLHAVVDGIDACKRTDGYIMAFPPETMLSWADGAERANYTRAWVTHGLIEAGNAGNPKAFTLLRGFYDWFNHCPYLPKVLRTSLGYQGMIADTRMYFTPVGKPRDIEVVQKYYEEDYWLNQLAARDERGVWQYPYNRPHCYYLTALEAYLDVYRATGERRYLDAVEGGWQLFHEKWEHTGGSVAICEGQKYPPSTYYVTARMHTSELCGSVFWVFLNQRFHLLDPEDERFVTQIEKSIYNVGLANQVGGEGVRYHALLHGKKEQVVNNGTCCEGQGTRLYGALPEFIYTVADDGVYVNLYEPSAITLVTGGETVRLETTTKFPFAPEVALKLETARPVDAKLRIRVPSWVAKEMPILVNGTEAARGKPGTYAVLERKWNKGDRITFTLPIDFRVVRYSGADQYAGRERYAVEYGPVLLAVVGPLEPMGAGTPPLADASKEKTFDKYCAVLKQDPKKIREWLKPKVGKPLHFVVQGDAKHEYMPYWQVEDQLFTCYPVMGGA